MGKSAQFPFHVWLPDAMEGPTPVSALIHAATMVTAGVYLLVRTEWLFALTPDVLLIVAWIGAFTALLAAVLACVQDDIKRVLAYSTVSQLGYMMTAIGAGVAAAGFFHLLTHGLFKALLFLGAGSVIHAVGSNDLPHMGGLARRMPQTAIVFIVGTLSLAGIPSLRRVPVEGGDSRRRVGGRSSRSIRGADARGLPHGVLHVPRRVSRVLRSARHDGRACARDRSRVDSGHGAAGRARRAAERDRAEAHTSTSRPMRTSRRSRCCCRCGCSRS